MFLTVHSTVGVIIGQTTGNIWLAFLAGFISHFLLDIIPHGDTELAGENAAFAKKDVDKIKKLALIDLLTMSALLSALYLAGLITSPIPVLFAIAGAIIPDFIQGVYILTKTPLLKKYFDIHYKLHFIFNGFTINLKQGIIVQSIFLIFFLIVIEFI